MSVAIDTVVWRSRLVEQDESCILNLNETRLFYKMFSRQLYIYKHENWLSTRGMKPMKSEDRIAGYVLISATLEYFFTFIMGKSKKILGAIQSSRLLFCTLVSSTPGLTRRLSKDVNIQFSFILFAGIILELWRISWMFVVCIVPILMIDALRLPL